MPLTPEDRARALDDLRGRQVAVGMDSPEYQDLQAQIDAIQKQIDSGTQTLEPLGGAPHSDDGWSPEALARDTGYTRRMPDGTEIPIPKVDGVDAKPLSPTDVIIERGPNGEFRGAKFGSGWSQDAKQDFFRRMRQGGL